MIKKQNLEFRRLILAKKMFLHGCDHASGKDEISRMFAIHHFDNSIELILKCAADKSKIDYPTKSNIKFNQLIDALKEKNENFPQYDQILAQHTMRNEIQHQANIPSFEDVTKFKIYTEDFLKKVCKEIFRTSFEKLYLSQLIYDGKLRGKIRSAERAYEKNDFKRCIILSENAISDAAFVFANIYSKAGLLTQFWTASEEFKNVIKDGYADQYKKESFYKPVRELSQAMLQLGMASTGMQFLDEYRMDFLKLMMTVNKIEKLTADKLKEEAQFSLNFVTNLILKWQEEKVFQEI